MRILVAGGGAVGAVVADVFSENGADVTLMDRDGAHLEAMRENGLVIKEKDEVKKRKICLAAPGELEGLYDAVFLAVKASRLGDTLRSISPHMHRDTFFISLQPGFAVELVGEMVEKKRAVGGVVLFSAWKNSPGTIEILHPGGLVVGELDGSPSPRLKELKEILPQEKRDQLEVTHNIKGHLWSHLCLSASVGSIGALTGKLPGEDLRYEMVDELIAPLWREVSLVSEAEEAELEKLEREFELSMKMERPEETEALFLLLSGENRIVAEARAYASSMIGDLSERRATEVDFINGHVVLAGKKLGLKTPYNFALLTLIREMERGDRSPGVENIREMKRRALEEGSMRLM